MKGFAIQHLKVVLRCSQCSQQGGWFFALAFWFICGANPPYLAGQVIPTPSLLKDVNETGGFGSYPIGFTAMNGALFFDADDGTHGHSLWKTDGTPDGTVAVKSGTGAGWLCNLNGTLFFSGSDNIHGDELWKSDGTTAGTMMVKDINPGVNGSLPGWLVAMNGKVFFEADDGTNGSQLWMSDGTPGGTVLLKVINPGGASPDYLVNVNGILFFRAFDSTNGFELWKSDGTPGGTVLVKDIYPGGGSSMPQKLLNANGTLFFLATNALSGKELWKSDGTSSNTVIVKDIFSGPNSAFAAFPSWPVAVGNRVYFAANDGTNGSELWSSDGTNTAMIKDIYPGAGSSVPDGFVSMNGQVYFSAQDGISGYELWKTDGSAQGTTLVKDVNGGPTGSGPARLVNVGSTLFFTANNGTNGIELWKSDGTGPGTVMLRDTKPGTDSSIVGYMQLAALNNLLLFVANDGVHGDELWKSDGVPQGTVLLKDINPTDDGSDPYEFAPINGGFLFVAHSTPSEYAAELWRSDGKTAGTTLVKALGGWWWNPLLFSMDGTVYFRQFTQLWKSDGTTAGTVLVKDINPGADPILESVGPPAIPFFGAFNGKLVFSADNGTTGPELWTSDGSSNGTVMVKDINPGTNGSAPSSFMNLNGKLLFFADDGAHGGELWGTDGTSNQTVLVKDINPGTNGSVARFYSPSFSAFLVPWTPWSNSLMFFADDGVHGLELWKTDGTGQGTAIVKDINPGTNSTVASGFFNLKGLLYFFADDGIHGAELWKTDGSAGGTGLVKDINPGPLASSPGFGAVMNGNFFFAADDGAHGMELWKSDGTSNGTVLVKDISAGTNSSSPTALLNVNGTLFFAANDGTNGAALWRTDGTSEGTVLAADIFSAPNAWMPFPMASVNSNLVFIADDGLHGSEYWRFYVTLLPGLRLQPTFKSYDLASTNGLRYQTFGFAGLNSGASYALYMRSLAGFNPLLSLYDTGAQTLLQTNDSPQASSTEALLKFTAQPGISYKVTAAAAPANQTGAYQLSLFPLLLPGATNTNNLQGSDPVDDFRGDSYLADDYLLQRGNESVRVWVEATNFTPQLWLWELSSNGTNRTPYSGLGSLANGTLGIETLSRTWVARVTSSGANVTGGYRVWVESLGGGAAVTDFTPTMGRAGQVVKIGTTNLNVAANLANVSFGGVSAEVYFYDFALGKVSATVPLGAHSGKITVSDGNASPQSALDFVVLSPLGAVTRGPGANFSFGVSNGAGGLTDIIEVATNLATPVSWQPIATNVFSAPGVWRYTNQGSSFPQSFFRARIQ